MWTKTTGSIKKTGETRSDQQIVANKNGDESRSVRRHGKTREATKYEQQIPYLVWTHCFPPPQPLKTRCGDRRSTENCQMSGEGELPNKHGTCLMVAGRGKGIWQEDGVQRVRNNGMELRKMHKRCVEKPSPSMWPYNNLPHVEQCESHTTWGFLCDPWMMAMLILLIYLPNTFQEQFSDDGFLVNCLSRLFAMHDCSLKPHG